MTIAIGMLVKLVLCVTQEGNDDIYNFLDIREKLITVGQINILVVLQLQVIFEVGRIYSLVVDKILRVVVG